VRVRIVKKKELSQPDTNQLDHVVRGENLKKPVVRFEKRAREDETSPHPLPELTGAEAGGGTILKEKTRGHVGQSLGNERRRAEIHLTVNSGLGISITGGKGAHAVRDINYFQSHKDTESKEKIVSLELMG